MTKDDFLEIASNLLSQLWGDYYKEYYLNGVTLFDEPYTTMSNISKETRFFDNCHELALMLREIDSDGGFVSDGSTRSEWAEMRHKNCMDSLSFFDKEDDMNIRELDDEWEDL